MTRLFCSDIMNFSQKRADMELRAGNNKPVFLAKLNEEVTEATILPIAYTI